MNLGQPFSACFDFDSIKANVPCGSNPVN
jgi:hypothetical protein